MKKFNKLDVARAPGGPLLTLFEHDGDYVIRVGNLELMSTRRHHSEERLAELACTPLAEKPAARVLIGGLGLGYTLKAALRSLPADAHVVVAEIVGRVIEWNRAPEYPFAGSALDDPRVELRQADVMAVLRESPVSFDAVILDVDNGAQSLTAGSNARLYEDQGIALAKAALRPRGRLAYWSANYDRVFERALRRAELNVETLNVPMYAGAKTQYTLFVARLPKRRGPDAPEPLLSPPV